MELILAFLGSLLPSVLFNTNIKKIIWVGFGGALGWFFYSMLFRITGREILSVSIGALSVGIYSEVLARIHKTPATVFSVSGVIPLVPGIGAYTTTQFIIEDQLGDALDKLIETIGIAGAIALGIMVATALFNILKRLKIK